MLMLMFKCALNVRKVIKELPSSLTEYLSSEFQWDLNETINFHNYDCIPGMM